MATRNRAAKQTWSSGLCSCTSDCKTCCYGTWCLPCLYGENADKLQGGSCVGPCLLYYCCPWFACFFAGMTREDLRKQHNLHETPCNDVCVHCWCSPCAVCQEARELKAQAARTPSDVAMSAPVVLRMM